VIEIILMGVDRVVAVPDELLMVKFVVGIEESPGSIGQGAR